MRAVWGEYLPDLPSIYVENAGNGVIPLDRADGVYPDDIGYAPIFAGNIDATGVGSKVHGAFSTKDDSGTIYCFVGVVIKLYNRSPLGTYTDVSRTTGGNYNSTRWEFTRIGNTVCAVGGASATNAFQFYTLGTSTNFENVSGAPSAKTIATVKNFVVVGNTYDSVDGNKPSRVRWSAIGDYTDWTVSSVTQSDYQDLDEIHPNPGAVQKVIGGTSGVIFCENAVFRMDYTGNVPTFWAISLLSEEGCLYEKCPVFKDNRYFYISDSGFRMISLDGASKKIGDGKVDRTFKLDAPTSENDFVIGGADPNATRVAWIYTQSTGTLNVPNKFLIYDYMLDRWSEYEFGNMDAVLFQNYRSSPGTGAEYSELSFYRSDHKLHSFSPFVTTDAVRARLRTKFFEPHKGGMSFIGVIRTQREFALTENSNQFTIYHKNTESGSESSQAGTAASGYDAHTFRVHSRYFSFEFRTGSAIDYEHHTGFDILESKKAGRR